MTMHSLVLKPMDMGPLCGAPFFFLNMREGDNPFEVSAVTLRKFLEVTSKISRARIRSLFILPPENTSKAAELYELMQSLREADWLVAADCDPLHYTRVTGYANYRIVTFSELRADWLLFAANELRLVLDDLSQREPLIGTHHSSTALIAIPGRLSITDVFAWIRGASLPWRLSPPISAFPMIDYTERIRLGGE